MSRPSIWEPEEERFLNKLRQKPSERQVREVRGRCEAELRKALASFLHAHNSPLNQQTINYIAKQVVTKYNNELIDRGIDYEIKLELSLK